MEEKIERPLIIEIDEAKKEIVQTINNIIQTHKLPFYILDMMMSDIYGQIKEAAKNELIQAQNYTHNEEV